MSVGTTGRTEPGNGWGGGWDLVWKEGKAASARA